MQSCSHQDSKVGAQNIHLAQWNRRENKELYTQLYGQLIFDKAGKNIQWKKRHSLQQMVCEILDSNM